ncbi:MAG TPA: hypothetical protein VN861_15890 [Candidatus Acidoferrales bacterium]|nr:hypothetical protein [Candidatus Acidoferrales bacterium]
MAYWVQYIEEYHWTPSTVLVIDSNFYPFVHFVMVEYFDFNTGIQWAIHSMPDVGVKRVPLAEALAGKPVKHSFLPPNPEEALRRMQSLIGYPYILTQANCEHPVRWAVTGKWESKQVEAVKSVLFFAGALTLAANLEPEKRTRSRRPSRSAR